MRFSFLSAMTAVALSMAILLSVNAAEGTGVEPQRPPEFVDLHEVEPSILIDMMYFTSANFIGRRIEGYNANVCYITRAGAIALKAAQARLKARALRQQRNLTLVIRDCYRPQKAVNEFVRWASDRTATEMRSVFYPRIQKSDLIRLNYISPISGHSRGSSVDLTIAESKPTGETELLDMGTRVDFFGAESHTNYSGISQQARDNRRLLLEIMSPEFKNFSKEWWHYVLKVEPFPSTSFNFDIDPSPNRVPQSTAFGNRTTQYSDALLLGQLDGNVRPLLSLANTFKQIHSEKGLPRPTVELNGRAKNNSLAAFAETYGLFAHVISNDIGRIVTELGIDWEKDITQTYVTSAAKTPAGRQHRGNGNVMRVFNEKWLTSTDGQFSLIGIVNRIDRKDFAPGTCGEVRLIYRLGYEVQMQNQTYASRMPFTINMVFTYNDDGHGCRDVASLWLSESPSADNVSLLARQLMDGPLDLSKTRFKQMEVNAQVARLPSDLENVENRKFAGQAIYLMRIFEVVNGRFTPKKLENTPDVQALLNDPEKKRTLKAFITANLSAIDQGTYLLPESLLADVAITYSTLGSARVANKPFDVILSKQEAQELLSGPTSGPGATPMTRAAQMKFIGSGPALLERLNTSTCMGCHQASSTAGFHFLGVDRSDYGTNPAAIRTATDGNRLLLPFSPHLYSELNRRDAYLSALMNGTEPSRFRPHPSAPEAEWTNGHPSYSTAKDNMPCPTGLANESLGSSGGWRCETGLTCQALVQNAAGAYVLGQCTPPANRIYAGLSCRKNNIQDFTARPRSTGAPELLSYNLDSYRDRVDRDEQLYALAEGPVSATAYNCRPTRIGVPLGRVTKSCSTQDMALSSLRSGTVPNEICAIVGGKGFEQMARGYFNSQKFAEGVGRGLLNSCTSNKFCREDYICQEMPDFLTGSRFAVAPATLQRIRSEKIGFCTPTYFVYQMRLDGHPNPR